MPVALDRLACARIDHLQPNNYYSVMIQSSSNTWKSNGGNVLLVTAGLATLLVCLVWYLNILPKIEFIAPRRPAPRRTIFQRPVTVLVVAVLVSEKYPSIVTIHRPFGEIEDTSDPVAFRQFPAGLPGTQVAVFTELATGNYAVSAFLDINDNGIFDVDPPEPRQFFKPSNSKVIPKSWSEISLPLSPTQPVNVRIDLTEAQILKQGEDAQQPQDTKKS